MKIDQPTLKRLHIEVGYLYEAVKVKSYTAESKDIKRWLLLCSDHLSDAVATLSIALQQTDEEKEKEDNEQKVE